jgi:hypothetical protein
MDRNLGGWFYDQLDTYRELIDSAIQGARSALVSESDTPLRPITEEARERWRIAATAALAGTVIALLADDRKRPSTGIMGFTIGGTVGLISAIAWSRRHMIEAAAEGAAEEFGRTRAAHWLERHPINYG